MGFRLLQRVLKRPSLSRASCVIPLAPKRATTVPSWRRSAGRVRVAGRVEEVAFGQLGWSVYRPHALLDAARRLLDHTPINRGSVIIHQAALRKGFSPRFTSRFRS
jgi:hypothetical protein